MSYNDLAVQHLQIPKIICNFSTLRYNGVWITSPIFLFWFFFLFEMEKGDGWTQTILLQQSP